MAAGDIIGEIHCRVVEPRTRCAACDAVAMDGLDTPLRLSAHRRMPQRSAGILLFRRRHGAVEVLLVHPGGPFWANKDEGAWSIPKGAYQPGEEPLAAARREFAEETGAQLDGEAVPLGAFRQSAVKTVDAWAVEGDFDPAGLSSNTFAMEWPPRSGRMGEFPEVDRAQWFTPEQAARKILKGQRPILQALLRQLGEDGGGTA